MKHKSLSYDEWKKLPKPTGSGEIHLLIDRMISIENAGMLLRTAEAMDVSKVVFYRPGFNKNESRLQKISRSAQSKLNVEYMEDSTALKKLIAGFENTLVLEYTNRSVSIYDYTPSFPLLLIVGNEKEGVHASILEQVPDAVHIPMLGEQSSINVACATSATLVWINGQT